MQKLLSVFVVALVVVVVVARPSEHQGQRLIKTSQSDPGQWMSEEAVWALKRQNVHFRDITNLKGTNKKINLADEDRIPEEVVYQDAVNSALSFINSERPEAFLTTFSSYFNRYYRDQTGYDSTMWLLSEIQASITDSRYNGTATAETYEHGWLQPSIITRIQGADPTLSSEIVVLGAHLDSYNFRQAQPAPGADDNGSGTSSLLEALRAILYADFIPKRTIEFQWYAAEEAGLLGSADIAENYANTGVDVVGMMNFDVTGYNLGITHIGITTDNVNDKLTAFLRLIVDAYLNFGWENRRCGYACSDHASFNENGFLAAFPVEFEFSPYMHSADDTMDTVNFEQVVEFSKLAVGYAIELGQPHEA